MFRTACLTFFMLVGASAVLADEPLNNMQFCEKALSLLADSLLGKLQVTPDDTIWTHKSDSTSLLQQYLVEKLQARGVSLFLGEQIGTDRLWLGILQSESSTLPKLRYQAFGQGLFRQGRVERIFEVNGAAMLTEGDGLLRQTARVDRLVLVDSLSFDQAKAAREGDGLYAPEMPASLFQRVVEPTLVVGITGTLVYLFFASR
ncbi:MAG: hypothetical protein ABIJ61_11255 [bacterium]